LPTGRPGSPVPGVLPLPGELTRRTRLTGAGLRAAARPPQPPLSDVGVALSEWGPGLRARSQAAGRSRAPHPAHRPRPSRPPPPVAAPPPATAPGPRPA